MRIDELITNKTILQSNTSGPFNIIKDLGMVNGRHRVLIKFINTGSERDVVFFNALEHRVKDPLIKGVSNDFDISRFDNYDLYINRLLKLVYKHMMDRCYNVNSSKYNSYGAKGVTVCDRWKSDINNFLQDARYIDNFDKYYLRPYLYEFDKDYKQLNIPKNKKVYSKDTCIFIYYQDNTNLKCIENKKPNSMFGVEEVKTTGNFHARIKINGIRIDIGTFNNKIAAANAYNYWQLYYHNYELIPLLNDVPYMPPNEFVKYNVNIKEMCTII